jgi:hypothetical protein
VTGQLAAGGIVLGAMLIFLVGAWLLLARLARGLGAAPDARLAHLPLGVPEGSVRALLSVFIIVFGFLLLAFAGPLGLGAGEALTGFIGAVISFYFASRAGERSARAAEEAKEAAQQARSAAEAAAHAGPAAPPPALDTLRVAQERLRTLRALLAAAGAPAAGPGPIDGVDRALARLDDLLSRIAPIAARGSGADPAAIARLAEEAAGLLRDLGELGPVGTALADAVATIGRAADPGTPIAGALRALGPLGALSGPAGLVAALVAGGLSLLGERDRFARWKAAMLDAPLEAGPLPQAVDAGLAAAALLRTGSLAAALAPSGTVEPAFALALWEAVGTPGVPADERAARLLAAPAAGAEADLARAFAGHPEALAEAIEGFRGAMTSAAALADLAMPAVAVAGIELRTDSLAAALRTARQDGRVAAEFDNLLALTEALGRADPAARAALSARLDSPAFWQAIERSAREP